MATLSPRPEGGKQQADEWEDLAEQSPKDKPWDRHRGTASTVAGILAGAPEGWIQKHGERVNHCSPLLWFAQGVNRETGEAGLTLDRAFFCKVRGCPVCQWRRSLMWKARMFQALPKLATAYPAARWIFLTLTEKNVPVVGVRDQLAAMGKSWSRLLMRKEFADVLGWTKSVEITRGKDGSAHPHFHVLLLVKSTYFKHGNYVSQARWVEAWKGAARLDYNPVVDVRAVRGKGKDGLAGAVAETLKYSVKPSDMTTDPVWFLELVRQVRKTRAVAAGGVLKDVLRLDAKEENADLLTPDADAEPEVEIVDGLPQLRFQWREKTQKYRRKKHAA